MKNHTQNVGEKLLPDPFIKNQNQEGISWSTIWNVTKFVFIACPSWGLPNYIKIKVLTICFYLIKQRGLELVFLRYFLHDFWRKFFLTLYFIDWPNFIAWLPLHVDILGNICIVTIFYLFCDVITFKINLSFFIKLFSTKPKSQAKNIREIYQEKEKSS